MHCLLVSVCAQWHLVALCSFSLHAARQVVLVHRTTPLLFLMQVTLLCAVVA